MGDYVYAFSAAGATVHRTDDLQLMVELELPGNEPVSYGYVGEPVAVNAEGDGEVGESPTTEDDRGDDDA
jgi:hypothetical protein